MCIIFYFVYFYICAPNRRFILKMRILYGASDEKFVQSRGSLINKIALHSKVENYEYGDIPFLRTDGETFDKDSLAIVFRVSPDTLLNITSNVVDKLPLPQVYEWTIEDVCRWIRKYGYRHYQVCKIIRECVCVGASDFFSNFIRYQFTFALDLVQ